MAELKGIINREEKENKRKRNYLIIGIVMVLLMVISPAGYAVFQGNSEKKENNNFASYNGVSFTRDASGYWGFTKNNMNFLTTYNPLEINDTNKFNTYLYVDNYKSQVLYFDFNDSSDGVAEISRNIWDLNKLTKRIPARACLLDDCGLDIPTKKCSEDKVISFREPVKNEQERVYVQENCVFIVANSTNQVKYADAFLFNVLGI